MFDLSNYVFNTSKADSLKLIDFVPTDDYKNLLLQEKQKNNTILLSVEDILNSDMYLLKNFVNKKSKNSWKNMELGKCDQMNIGFKKF